MQRILEIERERERRDLVVFAAQSQSFAHAKVTDFGKLLVD